MEIKKNYGPFGSTSLSVDEVLPDIQTGRAVYPDEDRGADASYMERINQYKHEGFHDASEDGGSSGGGDTSEPLIVEWVNSQTNLTAKEINDAFQTGRRVIMPVNDGGIFYYRPLKFIVPTESGYMSDWECIDPAQVNPQTGAITYRYMLLGAPSENDTYRPMST